MSRYVVAIAVSLVCITSSLAADVAGTGWRGPNRDGVATAFTAPKSWPKQLTKSWQIEVGTGHSSPVVLGGKIYQFSRQNEQEVLRCIDLAGKEVWKQSYDAPYKMHNAARGHGKGPKSTPWVDGDRICTLGIDGIFQCRQTETGKLLWQAGDDLPTGSPLYGAAASPLVVGGKLCLVHLGKHNRGALVALDAAGGKPRWRWAEDGPAYASPVIMKFGDTPQLVTQSQKHCLSLASDGSLLWKIPFTTGYDQNAITPVQYKDTVIFSGFQKGVAAHRPHKVSAGWTADEVWHNNEISMYMSTPVLVGERLFGFSEKKKGQLFCLSAATGKTIWLGPGRQADNAALLVAGDVIAALLSDGRLIFLLATGDEYQPVAEYQVADSPTWAHPVLLDGKVLVKDETKLTMWSFE